ncbi:MAG: ankyrin repeat domain-containing protein [Acidobacteria bacterium]|nr:ankyrin repeat domain-containing protein [Acidobacteriota bacterium]
MFAVINLHHKTVQTLLENGADVNIRAIDGATALMLAACAGDIGIVRALLNKGADVHGSFISTGKTAAVLAADHGYDEIAQLIWESDETNTVSTRTEPLAALWADCELDDIRNHVPKEGSSGLTETKAGNLSGRQRSTRSASNSGRAMAYSE